MGGWPSSEEGKTRLSSGPLRKRKKGERAESATVKEIIQTGKRKNDVGVFRACRGGASRSETQKPWRKRCGTGEKMKKEAD